MRILIGCECSGNVRRVMRSLGHDAYSCDLKPAQDGSPHHLQCDVLGVLHLGWDMAIFFPDCAYLTCSAEWAYKDGPYHQNVKPSTLTGARRRLARTVAVAFVNELWSAPIPKKALENPKGHLSTAWRKPDQIIQPWMFGDDASKETCIWLENLPPLQPTMHVPGRMVEWPCGSGKMVERWSNQTDSGQNNLPPSKDRAEIRAETYPGIASAMRQWTI